MGFTNTYTYDHARRLIREIRVISGQVSSNVFVYDGMDVIAKVDEVTGEMIYFTRGLGIAPGVGDVLAETHVTATSTQSFFYITNHRGDTVALVDQAGNIVGRYEYDAWGNVVSHSGLDAYFKFSSKHYDENAGLYYYGFRWYDPVAKRWTQPDPSGLSEGLDLYRFCGNDPINSVDIYGRYGRDFHFYITYLILRSRGYEARASYNIAGWAQYVDQSEATSPLRVNYSANERWHFRGSQPNIPTIRNNVMARTEVQSAIGDFGGYGSAARLGAALHVFADTYAHEGFTAWWDDENIREGSKRPNIGHADAGFGGLEPDLCYLHVQRTLETARAMYDMLPAMNPCAISTWALMEDHIRDAIAIVTLPEAEDLRDENLRAQIRSVFGEDVRYDEEYFRLNDWYFRRAIGID